MCTRRFWSEEVFRRFLVEHPLIKHLVMRIVWGAYDAEDKFLEASRVAEDGSFANANDEAMTLPERAKVGVVHSLEMPAEDQAKFAQTLAEYELMQPFKQLGRETYALTEEEREKGVVARWKGKKIATVRVLGLEARGWLRTTPQDGGHIACMERDVRAGLLTAELDPGIVVGALDIYPEQEIVDVGLGSDRRWSHKGPKRKLSELHPIVISEVIRDIESLYT